MRDVADQTRLDLTKKGGLCIRGGGGDRFIPLNSPCARFYNQGGEAGVEQTTVLTCPSRDALSPLPVPRYSLSLGLGSQRTRGRRDR